MGRERRRMRHPLSERFHQLLREIGALHDKKQGDYGRETSPFANVEASEEWGIPGWVGAMIRLNDKVRRLQKPAQGGTLSNEGVYDSLKDIMVYAGIAHVLYEQRARDEFEQDTVTLQFDRDDRACLGCDMEIQSAHNLGCPERYVPAA